MAEKSLYHVDQILADLLKKSLPQKFIITRDINERTSQSFITIRRPGIIFTEIAHIIIDNETTIRPYTRGYISSSLSAEIREVCRLAVSQS